MVKEATLAEYNKDPKAGNPDVTFETGVGDMLARDITISKSLIMKAAIFGTYQLTYFMYWLWFLCYCMSC